MKGGSLSVQFPQRSDGKELKILVQPETQHRARYLTEGSRGSVKDRTQQGFPTVKVSGRWSHTTFRQRENTKHVLWANNNIISEWCDVFGYNESIYWSIFYFFPSQLEGVNEPVVLQVFVANDAGRVKPHGFYQACRVTGRNTTACKEVDIEGTTVIEIPLEPSNEMKLA